MVNVWVVNVLQSELPLLLLAKYTKRAIIASYISVLYVIPKYWHF